MPVLRYDKSVFTKESQGIEFFVVDALLCKLWSTSKLCTVYIDICLRCRLYRMCASKKAKSPCHMRGIPSIIHQEIKPMDY